LSLSPYPPTDPPTPLPPPSALPRLVKQLPLEFTDSQLYDLFRPFGALASSYTQTHFGPDAGIVEFWNEEDAVQAEQAMHCAEVEGQNIAVQVYQPRRTTSAVEFNVAAPTFVPSGLAYPSYPSGLASPSYPSPVR
jgi:polyadenylate-binding protein